MTLKTENALQHIVFVAALALAALVLVGCGSDTTVNAAGSTSQSGATETTTPTPIPILITKQSGGCIRIGPNCALHTLYDDGTVEVRREADGQVQDTGQIDTGLVSNWRSMISMTDFSELLSRLPSGQCSGCVDGVDYEYEILASGNSVVLSSIDYQFDVAEPFFALTNGLYAAMQSAAPLATQSR